MAKEIKFLKQVMDETIAELIKECADEEEVILHLSSTGGSPSAAIAFHSFIREKKIKLTVNILGACSSAAVIILCAAEIRKASKYTSFVLHLLSTTWKKETTFTVAEVGKEHRDLIALEDRLRNIVCDTIDKTRRKMDPIYEAQTTLSAQEAYDLGLLTEKPY